MPVMCFRKVWLNTLEKSLVNPSGLVALPDGKTSLPLFLLLLEYSTSIAESHVVIFRVSLNLLVYITKGSGEWKASLAIVLHHANWGTWFQGLLFYCWIQSIISTSSECSTSNIFDSAPFVTRQSKARGEVTSYTSHPWNYNTPRWEEPWAYFLHLVI